LEGFEAKGMVLESTLESPDEMVDSLEHRVGYPITMQFKCYDGIASF
jgi:hypothetical protein